MHSLLFPNHPPPNKRTAALVSVFNRTSTICGVSDPSKLSFMPINFCFWLSNTPPQYKAISCGSETQKIVDVGENTDTSTSCVGFAVVVNIYEHPCRAAITASVLNGKPIIPFFDRCWTKRRFLQPLFVKVALYWGVAVTPRWLILLPLSINRF